MLTIMNEKVKALLQQIGYKCNAEARQLIAEAVDCNYVPDRREPYLKDWADVIEYSIEVGGAKHGTNYQYRNAQGKVATAMVYDL